MSLVLVLQQLVPGPRDGTPAILWSVDADVPPTYLVMVGGWEPDDQLARN